MHLSLWIFCFLKPNIFHLVFSCIFLFFSKEFRDKWFQHSFQQFSDVRPLDTWLCDLFSLSLLVHKMAALAQSILLSPTMFQTGGNESSGRGILPYKPLFFFFNHRGNFQNPLDLSLCPIDQNWVTWSPIAQGRGHDTHDSLRPFVSHHSLGLDTLRIKQDGDPFINKGGNREQLVGLQ